MPTHVKLKRLAEELNALPFGGTMFLNRETGQTAFQTEAGWIMTDSNGLGDPVFSDDEASSDAIAELIETSPGWLRMPSGFEVDRNRMMREFAQSLPDPSTAQRLMDSIGGKGTNARFKANLARIGHLEEWYAFEQSAYESIVRQWLDEYGIEWE